MKKSILGIGMALLGVCAWATDYTMVVTKTDNTKTKFVVSDVKEVTFEEGVDKSKTVTVKGGSTVNFVDLGLPSGTLWADRNIGATNPEDYGAYFSWGETSPKSNYSWSTYLDGGIVKFTDCGTEKDAMKGITDIAGNATYDAATANWGAGYKMPTKVQWNELNNSSYTIWTWCDGVNEKYNNTMAKGYKVTSKANGNSIFLPAAGVRSGTDTFNAGSDGYYWSSSLYEFYPYFALLMYFSSSNLDVNGIHRYAGKSVRPVAK